MKFKMLSDLLDNPQYMPYTLNDFRSSQLKVPLLILPFGYKSKIQYKLKIKHKHFLLKFKIPFLSAPVYSKTLCSKNMICSILRSTVKIVMSVQIKIITKMCAKCTSV